MAQDHNPWHFAVFFVTALVFSKPPVQGAAWQMFANPSRLSRMREAARTNETKSPP